MNTEDREWFEQLLDSKLSQDFASKRDAVLGKGPLLYGDFLNPNAEVKVYEEITDHDKVHLRPII